MQLRGNYWIIAVDLDGAGVGYSPSVHAPRAQIFGVANLSFAGGWTMERSSYSSIHSMWWRKGQRSCFGPRFAWYWAQKDRCAQRWAHMRGENPLVFLWVWEKYLNIQGVSQSRIHQNFCSFLPTGKWTWTHITDISVQGVHNLSPCAQVGIALDSICRLLVPSHQPSS
jgi:hypothetical protein